MAAVSLSASGKAFAVATKLIRRLFQRSGKPFALKRFIQRRGFIDLLHQGSVASIQPSAIATPGEAGSARMRV